MKVVKRDGKTVPYDRQKIVIAISKANKEVDEKDRVDDKQIKEIIKRIESTKKRKIINWRYTRHDWRRTCKF